MLCRGVFDSGMFDTDLIVIGAGAAGLMAATAAAERGVRVVLLEKNRKPGVKILMSGGTRCNLTHQTDARGIVHAFGRRGRFLHSALAAFGPVDLVDWFHRRGVATKTEPGGKVFPKSDRALDVQRALVHAARRASVDLRCGEGVVDLRSASQGMEVVTDGRIWRAASVLLTTGGKSYPGCGTTGDGYHWLRAMGHELVAPRPALVPLVTREAWAKELTGVTLADVQVSVVERSEDGPPLGKPVASRRGSLLFTHFGLSGPAPMDVSGAITASNEPGRWQILCDLLPDITPDAFCDSLRSKVAVAGRATVCQLLVEEGVPRRLAEAILGQLAIPRELRGAEMSKRIAHSLAMRVKGVPLTVDGTLGFKKAEVTAGGLELREVDSRTMQSRRLSSLFVAGEILDLDGPIGGYNFQAAFSTGYLAGCSIARQLSAAPS